MSDPNLADFRGRVPRLHSDSWLTASVDRRHVSGAAVRETSARASIGTAADSNCSSRFLVPEAWAAAGRVEVL
mgnify:CR=1 FL=1